MNAEVREKSLKALANSSLGDALRDLINEKITDLNDSSTITGVDKLIELEARQLAIKKLKEIFSKIKKVETPIKRQGEYE